MITIRVYEDEGFIRPDTRHELGGTDLINVQLFKHLVPPGEIAFIWRDLLEALALAHGWTIHYAQKPK